MYVLVILNRLTFAFFIPLLLMTGCRPLLPNEPRVPDWQSEQALTNQFLTPALANLEAFFLTVRNILDPELSRAQPSKWGKPYPLGQCLEISKAVQQYLEQNGLSGLDGASAEGYTALIAFLRHGGSMRQVWGDLRGEYFQNAFLLGTLYVDVSNDTVVSTKPKVEILPLEQARFVPLEDYGHFARVAARYWQAHIFPNHIVPALAPYFPIITVVPGGNVRFQSVTNYMIALTQHGEFRPSEIALDAPLLNGDLFQLLTHCFPDFALDVAGNPAQGRDFALRHCQQYRTARWHRSNERRTWAINKVTEANHCLARITVNSA